MTENLVDGLNENQQRAVTAGLGPKLILAGPGSGKTRVLTHRIAYLVREMDIAPWRIMAVTFTNKAAGEMRHRINNILGERLSGLQIGTFHATCARILRMEHPFIPYNEDYVIYDSDDQVSVVQQAMGELSIDTKKYSPRTVLSIISRSKNELILPSQFQAEDYTEEIVKRVYPRYQSILRDSNAMDFDDLLLNMVLAMHEHDELREKYQRRFQFVLVDEFQDTNTVQYQLVRLFGEPQNNVFAVGDEDQSIYAFRGADYRNVLRFREDHNDAEVILLEQNYRSTQIVLDVARSVIDHNTNRTPKKLFTDRTDGQQITIREAYSDEYEANYIMEQIEYHRSRGYDYQDIAVMYRTNAQSRAIERACVEYAIPYQLIGGVGFYKRREIRDLIAYLRVVNNPNDSVSFARIINTPRRGIGKKSLETFQYWTKNNNLTYTEGLQKLINGEPSGLKGATLRKFTDFAIMLKKWQDHIHTPDTTIISLLDTIRTDIGYHMYLESISKTHLEHTDREDNLQEFRGLIAKADEDGVSLAEFLIDQALMTDVDTQEEGDKVTLLTLHAAKGLEYGVVFLIGLEDGLLPHSRSLESQDELEEERRLFYVGITRAKDRLYLTYAFRRVMWGSNELREKSPFLDDIPNDLIDTDTSNVTSAGASNAYKKMTTWSSSNSESGLSRLSRDLMSQPRLNSTPKAKPKPSDFTSNPDIRSKIIRFPGSIDSGEAKFKSGQRVKHPLFGLGQVLDSVKAGGDEEVTIVFENERYGQKTLIASLANLTVVDG